MPYTPLNVNVYAAAFAGAVAGIGVPAGAFITDPVTGNYVTIAAVAAAYAQAVDTAWGAGVANAYDVAAILDGSTNIFTRGPGHPLVGAVTTQANWTIVALALVALVRQGDTDAIAEGITLPPISTSGGGEPFPPIANLAALALFDVGTGLTQLPAGTNVYLLSLQCPLRLVKYAGAPPALVPFETFAVLAGGAINPLFQWQRLSAQYAENSTANPWLTQLTWRIAAAGNDENVGTPASPLATLDEWKRRIEDSVLGPADAIAPLLYTIQLLTDQLTLDLRPHIGPMGMLVVDGQLGATVLAPSFVVGAGGLVAPLIVVPPAAPEYYLIQGPPLWNWGPYLGRRVRMLDGASQGATFFVESVNPEGLLDTTWARITEPMTVDLTVTTIPVPILGLGIVAGDHMVVEECPYWDSLTVHPWKELAANGVSLSVIVASGNFGRGGMSPTVAIEVEGPAAALPLVYGCRFNLNGGGGGPGGFLNGTGTWWGCLFDTAFFGSGKSSSELLSFQFCGFGREGAPGTPNVYGCNIQIADSVLVGVQMLPRGGGPFILTGIIGSFDITGFALIVSAENGAAPIQGGGCQFYGYAAGGGQSGIFIDTPGTSYIYDAGSPPLVSTGAIGPDVEMRITGANVLYAVLPYRDAVNDVNVAALVP